MSKVFLTERIHDEGIKILESTAKVVKGWELGEEIFWKEADRCDAILIRSAKISGELIKNAPNLKVVGKHGIGVDNIDVKAATERGIVVVNAPESNINAVAEHALTLIMTLAKNIVLLDHKVRLGDFDLRTKFTNMELKGKIAGIIGLGKIGLILVKQLQSLGMKIIGYDPYVQTSAMEKIGVDLVDDLDKIFMSSDIVSIHVPLNESTKGMIGEQELKKMKKAALLINVSRGTIIDEQALCQALKNGEIAGAALDVFEQEPPATENPLFDLDNIIFSPHNAALTDEALIAMATHSAQGIVDCLNGIKPKYVVNPEVFGLYRTKST
jgi:D-3-phosphoglycerate dehydrogenase